MSINTKLYVRAVLSPLLALVILFSVGTIANAQATPPSPVPPSLMPLGDLKSDPSTSQQLAYNPPADMIWDSLQQASLNAGPPKPVGPTPKPLPRPTPVPIPKPSPAPPPPPNQ